MAVTVSVYDHTVSKLLGDTFSTSHTYKINLYSAFTFNATHTTKAQAEVGSTQLSTEFGYTQDSYVLTNVLASQVTTNDGMWDADNVIWTASGGTLSASSALVYNDTLVDNPPLFTVNFGEVVSVDDGLAFRINWNASGIFRFNLV